MRASKIMSLHTSREVVLKERKRRGECTYCPPNRGDNGYGRARRTSQWGRKVAAKHKYATGDGRNLNGPDPRRWALSDKHYEERTDG